jgi:hypothetical protein
MARLRPRRRRSLLQQSNGFAEADLEEETIWYRADNAVWLAGGVLRCAHTLCVRAGLATVKQAATIQVTSYAGAQKLLGI